MANTPPPQLSTWFMNDPIWKYKIVFLDVSFFHQELPWTSDFWNLKFPLNLARVKIQAIKHTFGICYHPILALSMTSYPFVLFYLLRTIFEIIFCNTVICLPRENQLLLNFCVLIHFLVWILLCRGFCSALILVM